MSDNPEAAQPAPEPTPTPTPEPAPAAPVVEAAPAPATEAAAAPVKVKKSKKGLAIGITCAILGAGAIGGVAFALVNTVFKGGDAVSNAITKLLEGDSNKNIALNGTISSDSSSLSSMSLQLENAKMEISSKFSLETNVSDTDIKISGSLAGLDVNLGLGTKVLSNGDSYFKISGINSSFYLDAALNCVDDPTGTTNCGGTDYDYGYPMTGCNGSLDCIEPETGLFGSNMAGIVLSILSLIDEQWIKLPASAELPVDSTQFLDSNSQCLVSAMKNAKEYGKSLADIYKKNSFITSSTENISIAKKKDTIYRISFDNEKLAGFINEVSNSKFASDIMACSGASAAVTTVTADQVAEITKALPDVYVEIDGNSNFTRLYSEMTGYKMDFSFEYPSSIDVTAPSDAMSLEEVAADLMENFFGTNGGSLDFSDIFGGSSSYIDYDDFFDDYDIDWESIDFDSLDFSTLQ